MELVIRNTSNIAAYAPGIESPSKTNPCRFALGRYPRMVRHAQREPAIGTGQFAERDRIGKIACLKTYEILHSRRFKLHIVRLYRATLQRKATRRGKQSKPHRDSEYSCSRRLHLYLLFKKPTKPSVMSALDPSP